MKKFLITLFLPFCCYGFDLNLSMSGFDFFFPQSEKTSFECGPELISEENLRSNYCKNPYKTLCQNNPYNTKVSKESLYKRSLDYHFKENQELLERLGIFELSETNLNKIEDLISQCHQTTNETNQICEFENILKNVDIQNIYSVSKDEKKEFSDVLKKQLNDVYIHFINEEAFKYTPIIKSVSEVAKQSLIDTIKKDIQELEIHSFELGKNQEIINEFVKKLKDTHTLFSIAPEALKGLSDDEHDAAIDVYDSTCGKSGDNDNAAAYNVGKKSFILICPMEYLDELKKNPHNITNELFSKVSSTIIHELSHHFTASVNLKNSIPKANIKSLLYCMSEKYNGSEGIHQTPEDYIDEVMADYWANRTLAKIFKTAQFKGTSVGEKIKFLQLAVSGLCGTDDDGDHPSGRFRISQMLYRHKEIFNELKCFQDATIVVTSCTLNGPKILNLGF